MKKIKIFLASSEELKEEREKFEIEIYRKCKAWFDEGVFLHLDVWEDLSAQLSATRSQDEYNKHIQEADIFVLLAYTKVGMYTAEEFENAFGQFQKTQKPFIFTYFKNAEISMADITPSVMSLLQFKQKLGELGHFYANYKDFNDLWNQFNKELDRLAKEGFSEMPASNSTEAEAKVIKQNTANITGDKNVNIQGTEGSNISINTSNG